MDNFNNKTDQKPGKTGKRANHSKPLGNMVFALYFMYMGCDVEVDEDEDIEDDVGGADIGEMDVEGGAVDADAAE